MGRLVNEFNIFDLLDESSLTDNSYVSTCPPLKGKTEAEIFEYYNSLNVDLSHSTSRDDICTPMECVKLMIDYIPQELWQRKKIKVLDPCCGNGNFGAYCMTKTNPNNIYYNDSNIKRIKNCINILTPKHINCGNAFSLKNEFNTTYDLIMANPPYSGGGNKNQSLSNSFIELSIDLLNDFGYLCFVTPNNWMTYNNNNTTLRKLLDNGSFIVIDNDIKKYFPTIGSSFTVFVWQKNVFNNKTTVINNFVIKDIQKNVVIPKDIPFLPLYISKEIISIVSKSIGKEENHKFYYRCDLHNFTKKDLLNDEQNEKFKFRTIHTARKTRYAVKKQDIYDKWILIVPLSTYYVPYLEHNTNVTQSVGYIAFDTKAEAENYLNTIVKPIFKVIVHLTRYGNFNNIMVLKHLKFDDKVSLETNEKAEVKKLAELIKY